MRTAVIKFNTETDRVRGFHELATHFRVSSLGARLYCVPLESLEHLDAQHISCRRATDDEVLAANGSVRNLVTAVL